MRISRALVIFVKMNVRERADAVQKGVFALITCTALHVLNDPPPLPLVVVYRCWRGCA